MAGFRINRSEGQDDRDHQFDQIIGKSPALQIKEENDANTAS